MAPVTYPAVTFPTVVLGHMPLLFVASVDNSLFPMASAGSWDIMTGVGPTGDPEGLKARLRESALISPSRCSMTELASECAEQLCGDPGQPPLLAAFPPLGTAPYGDSKSDSCPFLGDC